MSWEPGISILISCLFLLFLSSSLFSCGLLFYTGSYYITQVGLKLENLLQLPPKCRTPGIYHSVSPIYDGFHLNLKCCCVGDRVLEWGYVQVTGQKCRPEDSFLQRLAVVVLSRVHSPPCSLGLSQNLELGRRPAESRNPVSTTSSTGVTGLYRLAFSWGGLNSCSPACGTCAFTRRTIISLALRMP